ncbi:MAG: tRNA3(Ser)-specific nuclease WapA precursor, partial [Planctomycetota bacterium]
GRDGSVAVHAQAPAPGSAILSGTASTIPGAGVLRIDFTTVASEPVPGYLGDMGRSYGARSIAGQPSTAPVKYGWASAHTDQQERLAPLPPAWTTQSGLSQGAATRSWSITLPNGVYPVAIVAGDSARLDRVNHLSVNGQTLTDPDPGTDPTGYRTGDFDGWVTSATVANGRLTVTTASGAVDAALVLIEIGPRNGSLPLGAGERMAALVAQWSDATAEGPFRTPGAEGVVTKQFAYGVYVDEPLIYVVNGTKYYVHQNHLFSVSAVTDAAGVTRERYSYTAYGNRVVRTPAGAILDKSQVNNGFGFTGYSADLETGLLHARARQYSSMYGRFVERDPLLQVDNVIGVGCDNYFVNQEVSPVVFPAVIDRKSAFTIMGGDPAENLERGGNLYGFSRGAPLQLDPTGLLSFNTDVYSLGDCGDYTWSGTWKLDKVSVRGGWIIQDIGITRMWFTCCYNLPLGLNNISFKEAWPVAPNAQEAGGPIPPINDRSRRGMNGVEGFDTYYGEEKEETWGFMSTIGSASFYEGLVLGADFQSGNRGTVAGPLPFVTNSQLKTEMPAATEGPIAHSIGASWNCCDGSKETQLLFKVP